MSDEYCGGFSSGYCGEFAAALHALTGYPLVAYYDSEGRLAHATVAPNARTRIDEHGIASAEEMLSEIKRWNPGRITQRKLRLRDLDEESMEGLIPKVVNAATKKILEDPGKYGL